LTISITVPVAFGYNGGYCFVKQLFDKKNSFFRGVVQEKKGYYL